MFALRTRLITYVVAWIAMRSMRRLRVPSLIVAIIVGVLLAAVNAAMSRREQDSNSEKTSGVCAEG
jgi:flagellar biosynthesis protein FliQ